MSIASELIREARRRAGEALRKARPITPGQQETARETRVALGLMADANAAGGAMTDEQRIFLAASLPGMRAREAVLLGIPNRSGVEESELQMIRREMARIEGRESQGVSPTTTIRPLANRLSFLAPLAASPLTTLLLSPWTWLVAVSAFALVQMGLKERIEDQRDEARANLGRALSNAREWQLRAEHYRTGLVDAAEVARHAADALAAERAAAARAAARERRRIRELQNVLTGSPDAPTWRLRDDGASEDQPTTPGG